MNKSKVKKKVKKLEYWESGVKKFLTGKDLEKFFMFVESLGHNYRCYESKI